MVDQESRPPEGSPPCPVESQDRIIRLRNDEGTVKFGGSSIPRESRNSGSLPEGIVLILSRLLNPDGEKPIFERNPPARRLKYECVRQIHIGGRNETSRLDRASLFCADLLSAGPVLRSSQQMKLEDVQKALSLVDKPQPVPDKYKAGFEAITAKDSIAMLTFISSDLLEGRETGTRGYQLGAEYAASLMKMWGLKPAGDMPSMGGGRGGMRGGAPARHASRADLLPGIRPQVRGRRPVVGDDRHQQGRRPEVAHLPVRRGLPGRLRRRGRHAERPGRLRRLRHPGTLDPVGRAQGPEPQGQDRPDAERSPRARRPQVALQPQEGAQGQVLPGRRPAAAP